MASRAFFLSAVSAERWRGALLQVMTPEVHHSSRAEPEHLQRLTEYVAHLESSIGSG
jgi:hypothetical protein